METKFTKGKWKLDKDIVIDSKGKPLFKSIWNCFQQFFYRTEQEQKANALLISKAPEMFEMLEKWSILNPEHYKDLAGFINETKQLLKEATEL